MSSDLVIFHKSKKGQIPLNCQNEYRSDIFYKSAMEDSFCLQMLKMQVFLKIKQYDKRPYEDCKTINYISKGVKAIFYKYSLRYQVLSTNTNVYAIIKTKKALHNVISTFDSL